MTAINKQNKESFVRGSSETICKAPFYTNSKFDDFYTSGQAPHVLHISQEVLEWFIGFFEGEGSFISDNTLNKHNSATNTYNYKFQFAKNKNEFSKLFKKLLVSEIFILGNETTKLIGNLVRVRVSILNKMLKH
jgi:hypothetical protein